VQIEAARRWAKDRGERLVASPILEIDVSGKLPLSKRPGLLAAIEMIEAGRADQPPGRDSALRSRAMSSVLRTSTSCPNPRSA